MRNLTDGTQTSNFSCNQGKNKLDFYDATPAMERETSFQKNCFGRSWTICATQNLRDLIEEEREFIWSYNKRAPPNTGGLYIRSSWVNF